MKKRLRSTKDASSPEQWLESARRGMGPDPQARGEVERALLAAGVLVPTSVTTMSAGAVANSAFSTSGAAANVGSSSTALGTVGGAKAAVFSLGAGKVALVALAVGAGGTGVYQGYQAIARPTPHVAIDANPEPASLPSTALPSTAPPPQAKPDSAREPQLAPVPELPGVERPPVAAHRPRAVTSRTRESTIKAELAALQEIQTALARGNGADALRRIRELDRAVPGGHLGPERRVSEVLALCQMGETVNATHLGRRLLARDGAFYGPRLSQSCAADQDGSRANNAKDIPKSSGGGN